MGQAGILPAVATLRLRKADAISNYWGRTRRHRSVIIFSFIRHFPFVEDSPGGIYLSGQTSNPANRCHLRIDHSIGIRRSFSESGPVVSGKGARLRSGKAAAPKNAPIPVKRAIWAANKLRSKPYRYGGGHKSFKDHGYDCSGTISYVLAAAGLINTPMSSTEFRSYGERGPGKWITIYAREGHTFAVIAGLRLDTTPFDHYTGKWAPRWYAAYRPPSGFDARHPIGL